MAVLTKDLLKQKLKRSYREVDIGGGDTARIHRLNEEERDRWLRSNFDPETHVSTDESIRVAKRTAVALSLVDESGARILNDDEIEQAKDFPHEIFRPIYQAAVEFSSLKIHDEEIGRAEKNSGKAEGSD